MNTASAEVDVHGFPRSRLLVASSRRRGPCRPVLRPPWSQVGTDEIVTRPGLFCAVGDGICVGRDDAWPVTPSTSPLRFTGGPILKVVVDASGERGIDHAAQVRGWFLLD